MKKRLLIVLVLSLLIGGGYGIWRYHLVGAQNENGEALFLYGNVEIRRVNLGFRVPGRISELLYEEGDFIEKGKIIARLDREPYEDAHAVASAQVESALENYEKMEAGNRPQEIEQARATLHERIASLDVLESDFKRARELVQTQVVAEQEYETVQARRNEAIARRKLAEENLNLLIEGFRKEDIAIAKARYSESLAHLKKAQTDLNDTEMICPNDGILLTRVEEVGSVVNTGQIIATLSLKDAIWVYVYVPETVYGKVFPGMKAEIYTDARPGTPYRGQVGFRSPEAEFTPKNVETTELRTNLVYRVRILVENNGDELPQGLPVSVKLSLKERLQEN